MVSRAFSADVDKAQLCFLIYILIGRGVSQVGHVLRTLQAISAEKLPLIDADPGREHRGHVATI